MKPSLQDFFEEEKKRVFLPGPYFSARVMAKLREVQSPPVIWNFIPDATRPVLGLALALIIGFAAIQFFLPPVPEQGFVVGVLEAERNQSEAPFLYSGPDIPADHELLNQLMGLEER